METTLADLVVARDPVRVPADVAAPLADGQVARGNGKRQPMATA